MRSAELGDSAALAALFTELGFPASTPEISARLTRSDNIGLVAVLDGRVVGVITINVMPVLHRPEPVGRISTLVVAHDCRNIGIGRTLVAHAEALLASHGCGLVEVTSNFRLEQAHGFYKSLGYETTSYRFMKVLGPTPGS
ncbi:GNAT family N-acetyltransferase [Gemmatimonas aurantiaca]|uniref:GNAT family N-acetyltransferase n=1 Tax=Gemmatimonas aurantiaca TaxID=173480 RepID=UPI00301D9124